MTVGVDIRVLGNKVKSGIEEYAENLLPDLIREGKDIQFKLFYSSHRNSLPDYGWLKESNVELYQFKYPNNLLFTSSIFLNRPFIDKMVGGADIFFFPHFFLSSLSPGCKRVTTFHDLSYLYFPEHLTFRKKIWHNFQMNPKWQAKFSDKIISVSESTKNDLISFYKIDPARIEVIYSGLTKYDGQTDIIDFKRKKKLPDRFILFLGKLEPRKNVLGVIKAFKKLKSNLKYSDMGLVIAGTRGWLYRDLIKETECDDSITFTGQLSDEERFLYYHVAEIFVYPSFFEGFGFPPLEAMSCGTPVITSRNSSLPEVIGDAAILADPYDAAELELWITKLLGAKKLCNLLVQKGLKQASKFKWKDAATKTLEVIRKA